MDDRLHGPIAYFSKSQPRCRSAPGWWIERLNDEIHKRAQSWGDSFALLENNRYIISVRCVVFHELHQPSGLDLGLRVIFCDLNKSETATRGGNEGFTAVENNVVAGCQRLN